MKILLNFDRHLRNADGLILVTFGCSSVMNMSPTEISYRVEYFGHGSKKLWPNKCPMSVSNVIELMKTILSHIYVKCSNHKWLKGCGKFNYERLQLLAKGRNLQIDVDTYVNVNFRSVL